MPPSGDVWCLQDGLTQPEKSRAWEPVLGSQSCPAPLTLTLDKPLNLSELQFPWLCNVVTSQHHGEEWV